MADSIESLGSHEVFPFLPNFRESVDNTFLASVTQNSYRGGSTSLLADKDNTPIIVRATYTMDRKEEISSVLDFVEARRARKETFWYYMRTSDFKLKEDISNGASDLVCYWNFYAQSFKTTDRLYFELSNGDTYVRRVTGVVDDAITPDTTITITPTIDADISVSEVAFFSRVLFVRLDLDEYNFNYESDSEAEVSIRLVERPTEYPAT